MNNIGIILLASTLLISCDKNDGYRLGLEEQVYESVFHHVIKDVNKKVYIASNTDSTWFVREKIEEVKKYISRIKEAELPVELLEPLYRTNQTSNKITWSPIIINAEFLPEEYASNLKENKSGYNCLVETGKGNVGIRTKSKEYRSYYTISKVIFSKNKDQALLKVGKHCAPMSGAGEWLVALRKVGMEWKISGSLMFWIS